MSSSSCFCCVGRPDDSIHHCRALCVCALWFSSFALVLFVGLPSVHIVCGVFLSAALLCAPLVHLELQCRPCFGAGRHSPLYHCFVESRVYSSKVWNRVNREAATKRAVVWVVHSETWIVLLLLVNGPHLAPDKYYHPVFLWPFFCGASSVICNGGDPHGFDV